MLLTRWDRHELACEIENAISSGEHKDMVELRFLRRVAEREDAAYYAAEEEDAEEDEELGEAD